MLFIYNFYNEAKEKLMGTIMGQATIVGRVVQSPIERARVRENFDFTFVAF